MPGLAEHEINHAAGAGTGQESRRLSAPVVPSLAAMAVGVATPSNLRPLQRIEAISQGADAPVPHRG